jgi:hypothetical protein
LSGFILALQVDIGPLDFFFIFFGVDTAFNGALAGVLSPKLWHKTDKYAQNQKKAPHAFDPMGHEN